MVLNSDDVIDSRDVIDQIASLESTLEDLGIDVSKLDTSLAEAELDVYLDRMEESHKGEEAFDRDSVRSYITLKALADEAEGYAEDWQHGATLIRDSYWVDYCREMIADIGDLPREMPAYIAIDWEKTADNLKPDYTSVEFDGQTYWIR
jgi:hypothetical protein